MPNRLIKESIWTSPNLNRCSIGAERHFYRLLPLSDDWGCFEATPDVVKGRCYPLQPATRTVDIEKWQYELQDLELCRLWTVTCRTFAQFTSWDRHNESLANRHMPTTPCPPWLLNESGFDTRLATETLHAFERIATVLHQCSNKCSKPTYREIHEKSKCSMSTISKFFKTKEIQERYGLLQFATNATPKNPNPNTNNIYIYKGELGSESVAPVENADSPINPYWNSMVKIWGEPVTSSERDRFAKNSREFQESGIDPSEIPIRHARALKAWKTIPCSPETLLKHWTEFAHDSPIRNGNGTSKKSSQPFVAKNDGECYDRQALRESYIRQNGEEPPEEFYQQFNIS